MGCRKGGREGGPGGRMRESESEEARDQNDIGECAVGKWSCLVTRKLPFHYPFTVIG